MGSGVLCVMTSSDRKMQMWPAMDSTILMELSAILHMDFHLELVCNRISIGKAVFHVKSTVLQKAQGRVKREDHISGEIQHCQAKNHNDYSLSPVYIHSSAMLSVATDTTRQTARVY